MRDIRSALFNLFFFGFCITILFWLWAFLPFSRRRFRRGVRSWPLSVLPMLRWLVGIGYEVRGQENIPDVPCIFAAKHQSTWDTLFFLRDDPDITYTMKRELLQIPLWGWYSSYAGHIAVDRDGGASSLKTMIRAVRSTLADGRSIVIFPEGTRVHPGETGTYFPGVAALYRQCDAPVVPVAVNSGMFWGRRSFHKQPGTIILQYLPAIPSGLSRTKFMAELQDRIEAGTRALEQEAATAAETITGPASRAT